MCNLNCLTTNITISVLVIDILFGSIEGVFLFYQYPKVLTKKRLNMTDAAILGTDLVIYSIIYYM